MKVLNSTLFWLCMMLPLAIFALDVSPATPEDELDESEDTSAYDEENGGLDAWSATNGTGLSEYGESSENEDDPEGELTAGETEEEDDEEEAERWDRQIFRRALRPEGAKCRRRRRRVCQRGLVCKIYKICTTVKPCATGATCPKRCKRQGVCTRKEISSTTVQPRTTTKRPRRRTRRTTRQRTTTTPQPVTTRRRTTPKA